jgi:F-type H+-transporting ATPase subunit gamma
LKFQGRPADRAYTQFEDKPTFAQVDELADRFIEGFCNHEFDRLDVAYTKFESASRQVAVVERLLPIGTLDVQAKPKEGTKAENEERLVEYEFLPSAEVILKEIVPAAFKARLFKCFLDAAVSEQIFRRVAMKAATENADDMIGNLSQLYNRARQTQITSELSEIIGGAAALE